MSKQWQKLTGNEMLVLARLYDGNSVRFFDEFAKVGKLTVWQTYNKGNIYCHIAFDGMTVRVNPDGSKVKFAHSYHFMGKVENVISSYKGR